MRTLVTFSVAFATALALSSRLPNAQQTPPRSTPAAASQPDADLAQLMRGVLFPNSNILFDVQQNDPAAPKVADGGGTANYANVYAGWPSIEGAAAAIEESADLILRRGRLCSNGKAAPVARADYIKFAAELREAGRKALRAAIAKDREAASDSTNDLAEACENCHRVYRDKGPAGSLARCSF